MPRLKRMKRLLIGCLWLVWGFSAGVAAAELRVPAEEPNEFHFVVLGDAQFDEPVMFNRLIDQTRRLRPAFVIQVGDLIEGYNNNMQDIAGEWARFTDQIAPLDPIPFFAVPGNHDLYNGNKQPDKRLEAMFEQRWGPLYFSFQYKNVQFIGLNTDAAGHINRIGGAQWQWLEEALESSTAEHKFAFMHRPPLLLKNADELHKLFQKHGVSHVFYGHHHHYHHLLKDGIHYSMTNAAGESIQNVPEVGGFRHLIQVAVRGAEVDVAVIEADAIKAQDFVYPQDNYDLFDLKRRLVPASVHLKRQPASVDTVTHRFHFNVPLNNTSRRDVQLFVSCQSADERWAFTPRAIDPVTIGAGERHTLQLIASFTADRVPESKPQCDVRLPLQTEHGAWLDIHMQVVGELP